MIFSDLVAGAVAQERSGIFGLYKSFHRAHGAAM
jgi:hypothetical protein